MKTRLNHSGASDGSITFFGSGDSQVMQVDGGQKDDVDEVDNVDEVDEVDFQVGIGGHLRFEIGDLRIEIGDWGLEI